jgi:putative ABC transport system substrate-binding protein
MRRQVVFASAAGALSLALAALAQQTAKPRRVGVLSARRRPPSLDADYYGAFPRRLNELGYVEGTNLHIEWRFADGEYQRLPELAAQLVKLNVDVILALGPPATLAAQQATATIPIVFVVSADPVASGIVKSLARPGGNTTGLSNLGVDLSPKHLELLLTIAPDVSRVALLINPANPAHRAMLKELETAIQASRVELLPISAQRLADIQGAFSSMELQKVGAVIVALDPFFIQEVRQLATEATRRRLPSIFAFREAAEVGGLMSYGQNQVAIYQARCRVRRPDPEGRPTGRPACRAARDARARHQRPNRENARAGYPRDVANARRESHRVIDRGSSCTSSRPL